jgi:hypothetical protein
MDAKTHWKSYHNYEYLGAYSLENGEDLELTISNVKQEMVKGQSGRDESCMVIYFEEQDKGMICNKTNAKTIQSVHGTPYIEEWTGKRVLLGTEKVSAFGETTDALRIRAFKPKVQIDPTEAIEKLKGALDLADLQTIWKSLSKDEQQNKSIINTKNTMKNELS